MSHTPNPTPPVTEEARISFIDVDGNLAVVRPDGTEVRTLTEEGGVQAFAWSPDASLAAVEVSAGGEKAVRIIRPDGALVFEQRGASQPLWSPQGGQLALLVGDSVQLVDSTGSVLRNIPQAVRPAWSPDGRSLAVVMLDGSTGLPVIIDAATGAESLLSPTVEPHSPDYPFAWHPDGHLIAYRDRLYEPATATERELPGTAAEWSPDGRILMIASPTPTDTGGTEMRLLDATKELMPVIGLELPPSAEGLPPWSFVQYWTDWTPDSRYLVYMDPTIMRQRVRIYDTIQISQNTYNNIPGERPDISPDGTVIGYMSGGAVRLLPLDGSALFTIADGGFVSWLPLMR